MISLPVQKIKKKSKAFATRGMWVECALIKCLSLPDLLLHPHCDHVGLARHWWCPLPDVLVRGQRLEG